MYAKPVRRDPPSMSTKPFRTPPGRVPLPAAWPDTVRAAVLHVIALAQLSLTQTRSWSADSPLERVRLRARVDELEQEAALLREELRIKDERMLCVPVRERPRYLPPARLAILALRAARGWTAAKTARAFHLAPATIRAWMKRLDDQGEDALVRLPVPVNKMPEFVSVVVQQLKATCPRLGKVRISQTLARAGLQLSASTVKRVAERVIKPSAPKPPKPAAAKTSSSKAQAKKRVVTSKYPHHVWHADLSAVPVLFGFWVPWWPFALTQRWPFGAWVAIVLDHFSRDVVARGVFDKQPSADDITALLDRAVRDAGAAPKYIVTDQGQQFQDDYRAWCKARGVRPRFGALGQHGSIAVIERFIRSMKD